MTTTLDPSLTDDSSFARTRIEADASSHWPPSPTIITHVLGGALAERVRTRFGVDADEKVTLTETTIYGGWEYTQDNVTEFTVKAGTHSQTFYPDSATADWREDAGTTWADSVFARFDAWLAVAERPSELFAEWFEHEAEAGQVVRFRARPDTILTRVAQHRRRGVDHVSLTGVGDHGTGRLWQLDLVAPVDADGFQAIRDSFILDYAVGMAMSEGVACTVLEAIADQLLPGQEH